MPVYNREAMVENAVRSIQGQTFEDWELIILDDASTDRTLEICKGFEAEDRRVRVFANEKNLGVGASRNRLLTFATGQYIAVQDSDDISVPERLAMETQLLDSKQDAGVVSGVTVWFDPESGRELWHYPVGLYRREQYPQDRAEMVRLLYSGCEVANAACMFRRSLVAGRTEPYGRYMIHDDWYFFLHAAHQTLFWGIPEVLVKMSRGKNHSHVSANFDDTREARCLSRDIYRYYKDDPQSPINHKLYRRSISILLTSQGKYVGGLRGFFLLLQAIAWDPSNRRARESLWKNDRLGRDDYSQWLES